jgi:hypothetical protein
MRKKTAWTIVGVLALLARVPVAEAWDSIGTYTHEKIADDAIASLAVGDYPDLHRFAEQLRDGSETENSHDLMNDGQIDLWGGDSETWWDAVETGGSRKGVLPWYKEHNFNNAYEMLGYMLHLEQDIDVPAHITYSAHGRTGVFTFHIDGLESYADGAAHFGYASGTTDWQFTDQKGYEWKYWLTDSEDDDDEDHDTGGFSLEDDAGDANDEGSPLIVDGPNAYEVPNTSWGTYGYGDYVFGFDRVPGLNEGKDAFEDYPKESIGKEQLKKSFDKTVAKLEAKSRKLPPLVPDDATHGQPSISAKIFGPNKPVDISLVAMENRQKTVLVSILAGAIAIKDTTGKVWDGSSDASYDLAADGGASSLPWKDTITRSWKGDLGTGQLADGNHTVKLKVKDQDGNDSEERTRSVKYDKTKPSGTITVNVIP